MKTIILYYSWSGKTETLASKKAEELGADIESVCDLKRTTMFGAFFIGCPKSIGRKKTKIKPINTDLSIYEKIIVMAPVWAGHPAPVFNNIAELIPSGKKIEIIMISGGGGTKKSEEGTKKLFTDRGCEVVSYTDVISK